MKLQAQGRAHNGRKFRETCETVVVNAHGALILLKHEIDDEWSFLRRRHDFGGWTLPRILRQPANPTKQ